MFLLVLFFFTLLLFTPFHLLDFVYNESNFFPIIFYDFVFLFYFSFINLHIFQYLFQFFFVLFEIPISVSHAFVFNYLLHLAADDTFAEDTSNILPSSFTSSSSFSTSFSPSPSPCPSTSTSSSTSSMPVVSLRGRKGWGDRSVNHVLAAIDERRSLPFHRYSAIKKKLIETIYNIFADVTINFI